MSSCRLARLRGAKGVITASKLTHRTQGVTHAHALTVQKLL